MVTPPSGNYWRFSQENLKQALAESRVYFGKDGDRLPIIKRYLTDVQDGVVPRTWWPAEDAGSNQSAKRDHLRKLLPEIEPFSTPKPEELIHLIFRIATKPGDLILDSFLGSGTAAAVAHKTGRRYIGIEMGEHARTHCVPRLEKVIEGESGGISHAANWSGGGGFSLFTLGEAAFDEQGQLTSSVRFATLAAYIWHLEIGTPGQQDFNSPFMGEHKGTSYFLLYNGILGDRRPASGNVLTSAVVAMLRELQPNPGPIVVYGENTRLGSARMNAEDIIFKQIPYDVKMR